ncbi:MAG: hypothetical protein K6E99_04435, partial [Bacilli bacterium]|nr:hypothetical protein [Bacilli bacterium]
GTLGDNKYYKLVNDLSFDCDKSYVDTSLKNTLTSGTGFTPIGVGSYSFKSSFDGNNKKIYGLYMNDSSKGYAGFIGYSYFTGKNKYIVKNLSILDADVTLGADAGIVIGRVYYSYGSDGGYIENIKTSGKINCSGYCGGIVGEIDGVNKNYYAKNLVNKADINSSNANTGGIIGRLNYINVTNATNYGNIKSTSSYVGGVIGQASTDNKRHDGEIRNLENHGNIEVKGSQVGGVIGSASKYDIYDLKNYGEINIIEGMYTGGVLGELYYDTKVYNAYNYNKIKGKSRRIGGITGYMSGDSLLYNAYNYGDVEFITNDSTNTDIGGIVANMQKGFVMNCGNHGNVISNNSGSIGGIIGESNTYATNCYNYGNIINKQFENSQERKHIGGLVGSGIIKNSYNIGDIILDTSKYNGTDNYVGFLIGDPFGVYNSSNLFAVGNITDNNAFGSDGNHYGVLFGSTNKADDNFYVKGNISNLKYVNLDTSGYENGYADIYSDAYQFKSYNDFSTKEPGIHYNLNNSPNKSTINLTEEYDFSKVNGMWFRDTLKLGDNWKYSNDYYPKLYKVLPNGSISNELVEGQKDIVIK